MHPQRADKRKECQCQASMTELDTRRPTVVVADDHPGILENVSTILSAQFDVVGQVADGQAAVLLAANANPDIVVLDIEMPLLNGFQTAAEIRRKRLACKIVFLTIHDDLEYRNIAKEFGASGYVLKCHARSDLIPTLRQALDAD